MEITSVIMRIKHRQAYQLLPTPVCSFTIWQNAASQIPLQVEQNSEANPTWGPAELVTEAGAYPSLWARCTLRASVDHWSWRWTCHLFWSQNWPSFPAICLHGWPVDWLPQNIHLHFFCVSRTLALYCKTLYFVQIWCWKICGYKIPGLLRW